MSSKVILEQFAWWVIPPPPPLLLGGTPTFLGRGYSSEKFNEPLRGTNLCVAKVDFKP